MMKTFVITDEDEYGKDAVIALVDAESWREAQMHFISISQAELSDFEFGSLRCEEPQFHYRVEPATADPHEVEQQITTLEEDRGTDKRG